MERIEHDGMVTAIHDHEIEVAVISKAACVSCQIKSVCNPSDVKEKVFKVPVNNSSEFTIGDTVTLSISEGSGMLAVLLGLGFPVMILLAGFFSSTAAGLSEPLSALIAVVSTAFYYLILYLTRKRAEKRFAFTISRHDH